MPTFFGVIEPVHLDALKIVLVLTHIATFHVSLTVCLLISCLITKLISKTNLHSLFLS